MKVYDAASIRNVAVVGHGGCGKTQLVSALLFASGMVNRLAKVDEGNTVTDYDDEEIARKHTLSASLAYAEWNKTKINLIDTPGFGNFFSDARAALGVCDAALVVVDAVAGVEVQTEKAWEAAQALDLPRIVVLHRIDRDRASLERSLESLRQTCGRAIVPIQLPIGEERNFSGVVDLVTMKAFTFATDGSGKMSEGAVPEEMMEAATAAREALIEMVAEADEQLMEKFFDAGTLTQEELDAGLKAATHAAKVFPLVCASGLVNAGSQPLLDVLVNYAPSPADRPFRGDWPGRRRSGADGGRKRPTRRSSGRRWRISLPAESPCSVSTRAASSRIQRSSMRRRARRNGLVTSSRCRARTRRTCRKSRPATLVRWPS